MKFVNVTMLILLPLFVSLGCSKPLILDQNIQAKWYKKGDGNITIPFDGILLNDYTYIKLREKIMECEK